MDNRPGYFGGSMRVRMDNGQRGETWLDRDLWFDQDIDGRWLVAVNGTDPTDETLMGSVIIRDKAMGQLLATLRLLLINPAEFAGDPLVVLQDQQ